MKMELVECPGVLNSDDIRHKRADIHFKTLIAFVDFTPNKIKILILYEWNRLDPETNHVHEMSIEFPFLRSKIVLLGATIFVFFFSFEFFVGNFQLPSLLRTTSFMCGSHKHT